MSFAENNWGQDTAPTDFDTNKKPDDGPKELLWVHLRGLPWKASEEHIIQFLEIPKSNVEKCGIELNHQGRPSGSAYVCCNTRNSAEQCLQKHRETFPGSQRYVEIFDVDADVAENALGINSNSFSGSNFGQNNASNGSGGEVFWVQIVLE